MTLGEKIKIIAENIGDFSANDKNSRAKLCCSMHTDLFKLCGRNRAVFHVADRLGLFSDSPRIWDLSQKGRATALRLGLVGGKNE